MKLSSRVAMFVGLILVSSTGLFIYGEKAFVPPCVVPGTGTDSCSDGPFWSCVFPACYDFHTAGNGDGQSWDEWNVWFPGDSGFRATTFESVVCSCTGLCVVEALDPYDPENHTCSREDSDNWNCSKKTKVVLDYNDACP